MRQPLRILSLGAGVQSTVLLLMSCRGIIPKFQCAVFADTQWEPASVYRHLEWLEREAVTAGIPVHRVTYRNLRSDLLTFRRSAKSGLDYTHVPLYVRKLDGNLGMLSRQCTAKYKIGPIDQFLKQQVLGLRPGQIAPKQPAIAVTMGITWDERQRMNRSPEPWKVHVYPFCMVYAPDETGYWLDGQRERVWTRQDCLHWLHQNYPGVNVPRSACIGCPYRSNAEWRRIRSDPESWADAVLVDEAIRQQANPAIDGTPYLHRSGVPLVQADLQDDRTLWDGIADNACEGMCGV